MIEGVRCVDGRTQGYVISLSILRSGYCDMQDLGYIATDDQRYHDITAEGSPPCEVRRTDRQLRQCHVIHQGCSGHTAIFALNTDLDGIGS